MKPLPPETFLKVHLNPLNLERGSAKEKRQKMKTFGFDAALDALKQDIVQYFESPPEAPFLATIKGEIGSGKSVFALNLIDELLVTEQFRYYQTQSHGSKLPILTSTINPESDLQFLNAWRPILQMLLAYYCKKDSLRKDYVLKILLQSTQDSTGTENKRELLREILGIPNEGQPSRRNQPGARDTHVTQLAPTYKSPFLRANPFIARPDYANEDRQQVIELLSNFVKLVLGETEDVSGLISFDNKNRSRQMGGTSDDDDPSEQAPVIFVLDNAHLMDVASWQLYEALSDDCRRICIILLMQTDDQDNLKIGLTGKDDKQIFETIWGDDSMEEMRVVDLPRLDPTALHNILAGYALKYQSSHMSEVQKMTEIVDPKTTIKNKPDSDAWRQRLVDKWQLAVKFSQVDAAILEVICTRCNGNPLLCMQYFVNLLHNDFIRVQPDGHVKTTDKFKLCQSLNDWKAVPVPRLALKLTCTHLDKYLYAIQTKRPNKPGEIEACVTSIVMLKAATVLGDEFESKALGHIQPLRQAASSRKYVKEYLKLLEKADLIEILDETDTKNCLCRFNKCLLRESIY